MTAIAGFAVLVVSDIRMLRDFGFVTVVDLTVSLLGVLVVLPAVLVLAERGRAARSRGAAACGGRRVDAQRAPDRVSGRAPRRLAAAVRSAARRGRRRRLARRRLRARCNTLRTRQRPGSSGGVRSARKVPPFAAPLALGDARRRRQRRAQAPTRARPGKRPAARCAGRGILNSASSRERGPVVLAFFATRGAQCTRELDVLAARARRATRAVQVRRGRRSAASATTCARSCAATAGASRSPRTATACLANLYGVAVCPQLTYALPRRRGAGDERRRARRRRARPPRSRRSSASRAAMTRA